MHPTHWLISTQAGAADAVLPRQRLHLFFGDAHVHLRNFFYGYTYRILLPERERVDALQGGQAAGHELLEVGEPTRKSTSESGAGRGCAGRIERWREPALPHH